MALRISATGLVSILFVLVLTIRPGCVLAGSRTRLWHVGSGVRENTMVADCMASWRERLIAGDELGRKGWRKLLFARRRSNAPVVESTGTRGGEEEEEEPAANEPQGQASLSRFAAAFRFFSSMAKGSPSPSPATPSPGHN